LLQGFCASGFFELRACIERLLRANGSPAPDDSADLI